jgi:hypothetical protein
LKQTRLFGIKLAMALSHPRARHLVGGMGIIGRVSPQVAPCYAPIFPAL